MVDIIRYPLVQIIFQVMEGNKERLHNPGVHNASFKVEGREDCSGYYTNPNNSEYGLVMLQEWWGLNESLVITANKVAASGYQIVVPDIYRGKVAKDRQEAGHLFHGLDWEGALKDIAGAKEYLTSKGAKKIGIVGFCMGGALAIAAVASYEGFDAAAPFYGIPDLSKYNPAKITCRVEVHTGENDSAKGFSDPEACKNFVNKVKQTNPEARLILHKNAGHAFMNQDSENFNQEAYDQALKQLQKFFH